MAHDPQLGYSIKQYALDVRSWAMDTVVDEHRQGRRLIGSLGGEARRIFVGIEDEVPEGGVWLPDWESSNSSRDCPAQDSLYCC